MEQPASEDGKSEDAEEKDWSRGESRCEGNQQGEEGNEEESRCELIVCFVPT